MLQELTDHAAPHAHTTRQAAHMQAAALARHLPVVVGVACVAWLHMADEVLEHGQQVRIVDVVLRHRVGVLKVLVSEEHASLCGAWAHGEGRAWRAAGSTATLAACNFPPSPPLLQIGAAHHRSSPWLLLLLWGVLQGEGAAGTATVSKLKTRGRQNPFTPATFSTELESSQPAPITGWQDKRNSTLHYRWSYAGPYATMCATPLLQRACSMHLWWVNQHPGR